MKRCKYCGRMAHRGEMCNPCRKKLPAAKALADVLKQIREIYNIPKKK